MCQLNSTVASGKVPIGTKPSVITGKHAPLPLTGNGIKKGGYCEDIVRIL